jgi:hypothetical protein
MDFTWVAQDDSNAIQNAIVDAKGDLIAASAADTPARLAVGNNGETLVADSSTSTGLRYQGNFAAGKNKIINGDFGIWQRGTSFSSTTASQYLADRFYYERGSGTYSASRQTFTPGTAPVAGYEGQYFLRVSPTVAGDMRIAQYIENVQTFAGQTVTFSFWAKASASTNLQYILYSQNFGSGGSGAANNTTGAGQTVTTSWARYSFTVTMDSIAGKTIGTSSYVRFAIDLNESFTGDFDTWGWQVEAGSVATAFQTATGTIQGELAACQRYYQVLASGVNKVIGTGAAYTASQCDINIFFAEMRIAPSLVATSGTGYYKFVRNGGTDPFDSITLNGYTTTHSAMCYNNTEISSTAGNAGWVYIDNASGSVALNAEL